jgi:hypothetical protein
MLAKGEWGYMVFGDYGVDENSRKPGMEKGDGSSRQPSAGEKVDLSSRQPGGGGEDDEEGDTTITKASEGGGRG